MLFNSIHYHNTFSGSVSFVEIITIFFHNSIGELNTFGEDVSFSHRITIHIFLIKSQWIILSDYLFHSRLLLLSAMLIILILFM